MPGNNRKGECRITAHPLGNEMPPIIIVVQIDIKSFFSKTLSMPNAKISLNKRDELRMGRKT
jgi:hypothetical protein